MSQNIITDSEVSSNRDLYIEWDGASEAFWCIELGKNVFSLGVILPSKGQKMVLGGQKILDITMVCGPPGATLLDNILFLSI